MLEENLKQPTRAATKTKVTRTPAGVRSTMTKKTPAGVRSGVSGAKTKTKGQTQTQADGKSSETKQTESTTNLANPAVILKKFSPVYITRSANADVTCSLCRNSLDNVCNKCIETRNTTCPVIKGICGHQYHNHCISEWLKKQYICPAPGCGIRWETSTN